MQQILLNHQLMLPLSARNVSIWLIQYYCISRGNELSLYWGMPYYVDNYEAIKMWVESRMQAPRPIGRTLRDLRLQFEEQLPI